MSLGDPPPTDPGPGESSGTPPVGVFLSRDSAETSDSLRHQQLSAPESDLIEVSPMTEDSATSIAGNDEAMERGSSILSESVDMAADASPRQALTIDDLLGVDEDMETETVCGSVKDAAPSESVDEFPPLPGTSSSSHSGLSSYRARPSTSRASTSQASGSRPPRGSARGQGAPRGNASGRGRGRGQNARRGAPQRRQPAPLPRDTPPNFWHYLVGTHPWADLVNPRRIRMTGLSDREVKNAMPTNIYKHIPNTGYLSMKFAKSLFPIATSSSNERSGQIPIIELQTMEDAVRFRFDSQQIIDQLLSGNYPRVENTREPTAAGEKPSLMVPPLIAGRRPVLYQVIATNRGTSVVLEAKDFLVIGPDRRDLHCIVLDQFATNIQSDKRGFDRALVSIKDLVWVWDVEPTRQAIADPPGTLERSRIPRTTALDNSSSFFFRAATYAFVTPAVWANDVLGNVISITRRDQEPTKFRAAFEGAPEAVVVTQSVCDFALSQLSEDEMLLARSRPNVSCAIRFSEPPASVEARKRLCRLVKNFLPCHPEEGILPLKVSKLGYQDLAWLHDRANQFDNFCLNPIVAKEKMSHLFNVACSTLAAIKSAADDRRTHWVRAVVPSLRAYPIRISLTLTDMPTEAGWTKGRPAEAWIDGAPSASHMQVHFVGVNPRGRELHITLMAQSWSHSSVLRAIESNGRRVGEQIFVDVCVKLGRVPVMAEPAYEIISRMNIFENIRPGTTADRIVNRVYGLVALGCADGDEEQDDVPREDQISLTIRGRQATLTLDQQEAGVAKQRVNEEKPGGSNSVRPPDAEPLDASRPPA
ncbi:hypothetical protein ANCCAN_05756 [Ancylostoma caninum]|uniref:Uncharacterized protein n=1 Tax=Ancylostoma caninum TaxID=29170 RepID=A0A368GYZ2_ANCCA|nr:hypothetical protein ANCCAN_05756 [Ancylostoma caninum]